MIGSPRRETVVMPTKPTNRATGTVGEGAPGKKAKVTQDARTVGEGAAAKRPRRPSMMWAKHLVI